MSYRSTPIPSPKRAQTLPTWLLVAVPAVAWASIIGVDAALAATGNPPPPGLHSIALVVVPTLTGAAGLVWLYQQIRRYANAAVEMIIKHVTRETTDLYRTWCRANDMPTVPILRIVGTASVVVPQPSQPMAEVVQMPSPATVAAMRRLAEKITEID